jgi:hypothetical protein
MDSPVRATPQVTAEQESFSLPEILDAGSVTSQFYEDGSVNFSDTPPPVTRQSSHAQCHTSDVTRQASQQPDQPPPAQRNRGMPRNHPANTLHPSMSTPDAGTSSRGRVCTMTRAMADSIDQRSFFGSSGMHYMSAHATTACNSDGQTDEDLQHEEHLSIQDRISHPIAFHAEMMGDIMYLNQAIQQPDADQFMEAVIAEVNGHVDNKHWQLTKRSEVPPNNDVLPSVRSMRRKRDITTNEIKKYKARLNLHGGKQEFGTNYYETYAPVVTWFLIRLLIVIGIIFGWALRQCDFVMAYPQAPIECNMYMELTQGIQVSEGDSSDYVSKLLKNIYGQKQASRVWNEFLVNKLTSLGYQASMIDDCIFYRGNIIFMVYVDDGIFLGQDDEQLKAAIREIQDSGLNIKDQGHPADYVGVNIKKLKDGSYEFTQRALINSVIADVGLTDIKTKPVPAKVVILLHAFKDCRHSTSTSTTVCGW